MEGSGSAVQANIWKYYLFHFFLNLQLWFPIWVIYLTEDRGLSLAQVTLIDIPFWLCIIVLQIPGAAIADRWGRKPTLAGGGLLFAAAITFFGLATTFWLILLSYLVWGIAFALLYGTESAFIYDSLKSLGRESEYPKFYGRGWAIAMGAAVVGTLVGAPVADATSLSFPIVLSGGIAALAGVTALTFKEPPREERTGPRLTYGEIIRDSVRIVRKQPAVRYSILFFGLLTIGSVGPIFFFQVFLVHHNIDLAQVGLWQTPMRFAAIIGALAAHRLIVGFGERRIFYAMPAALVGSFAMLAIWDSVYAQIAFPVMNFVVIMAQPTVTDYLNRRVGSEQRATVLSLTNLIRSIVLIPTAPLLASLADNASDSAAYAAGGIMIAVLGIPLLALWFPHLARSREEERRLDALAAAAGGSEAG